MPLNKRVVQNLNQALHSLMERDERLYVLGQDIADPYGGAFGATRGLSDSYPERVLSTPISESGTIGVANGLALCGDKVIVEFMFGDFAGLAFDQLMNFTSKAVSMYGHGLPMPVVARCPVGGNRGYGPTHSQSLQKYFMGIPHLSLYELSPFHDAERLLAGILERRSPAILFEPKALYSERVYRDGKVDDLFGFDLRRGEEWAHVYPRGPGGPEVAVLAPGGVAGRAIESARVLGSEDGVRVHILIPSRLYPLDIRPVADLLAEATMVCVVEESSPGGTWGTEVARHVHEMMWGRMARPVLLINSRDSVIPAAPHLEKKVLVGTDRICSEIRTLLAVPGSAPTVASSNGAPAFPGEAHVAAGPGTGGQYVDVTIPKLNSNDAAYVLLDWLTEDDVAVQAGDPIAEIETSKAVAELPASSSGVMVHGHTPGTECRPGDTIARLFVEDGASLTAAASGKRNAGNPGPETAAMRTKKLSRNQLSVAETVSTSHREIPEAFVVMQASIDPVLTWQQAAAADGSPAIGLLETLVVAVASLAKDYPECFCSLLDAHTVRIPDGTHVGVTLDAGHGLFIPVVRFAEHRSADDVADLLAAFRLQAVRGAFTEADLTAPNIVISWNYDANVSLVKPVIPPGVACVISVGGPHCELSLTESGQPVQKTIVNLGLTHDHRIVNGREAVGFLREITAILGDEGRLKDLVARR